MLYYSSSITINISTDSLLDMVVAQFGISQSLGDRLSNHVRIVKIISAARFFKLERKINELACEWMYKLTIK